MRPLQSRAWTRRGEEEEEEEEDEDGVVDFPLCELPPRAVIFRRRSRRSRRIPSFFHLERFRIGASQHLERERERENLGRNGESVGECVELETEVFLLCKKD
jgi:hypothetical protein